MDEIFKYIIKQSGVNGIFCLLFVCLLAFVLFDSHTREKELKTINNKLLEIIENFKLEFQKISQILQNLTDYRK
jgi:hypothetical protein